MDRFEVVGVKKKEKEGKRGGRRGRKKKKRRGSSAKPNQNEHLLLKLSVKLHGQ